MAKKSKKLFTASQVEVDVWEERDRLSIVLRDKATQQVTIAEWWDDDARQMFEDGFFESGRKLKESVIKYAEDMGILAKPGLFSKNPGETGWRKYGPGKYDAIVDSYVHALDGEGWGDEEIGDVSDFGWYGLMSGDAGFLLEPDAIPRIAREEKDRLTPEEMRELKETVGVIIHENDQGFVGVTYYKSAVKLKKAWEKLAEEAEEFYQGVEE